MRISPRLLFRLRPLLGGLALASVSGAIHLASQAVACPSSAEKQATVPLDLGGGVTAPITVQLFDYDDLGVPESHRPEDDCHAWFETALSSFPSIESRYTTARVADAIAETLADWGAESCSVAVYYQNDVDADFAWHELCRNGRYGFADARAHSLESEAYCWEPEQYDFVDTTEHEMAEDEMAEDVEFFEDEAFEDEIESETELADMDAE